MFWIVGWIFTVVIAPFVLFRFLGQCNRRHGLPEDQVEIGGEEAMMALGVVLFAPVLVPIMGVLMLIDKINNSDKEWLDSILESIENACNKFNSSRMKEKKDE